jgi:murein DD-endopeptidase MepM/ murein hydrolase activator NlpD
VVIDIGGGRYLLMGHLSPGSIQVKVGDPVKLGQQIAKVGNSGNTTEPHLHIQAQTIGTGIGDVETMDVSEVIRTLHTYPLVFSNVVLTRRGMNPDQKPPTHVVATCSGQPSDTEHENATSDHEA